MTTHLAAAVLPTDDLTPPLACVPGAIAAGERAAHFALVRQLFTTDVREVTPLAAGYAYRFDADAFDDVARWIANERRCCPFLAFTLELTPAGRSLVVSLTGPAGTREFLDAELPRPTH